MHKKKIFITGGSGFLAKHLVEFFQKKNKFEIHVLDKKIKYKIKNVKYHKVNILDLKKLKKVISKNSTVYHFAAISDIEQANRDHLSAIKVNIIGTVNVLEACKENQVKKIIFASSIYSMSELGGFYSSTKFSSELLIERYSKKFKLNYIIIRFGSLYGKYSDNSNTITNLVNQAWKNNMIIRNSDGKEIRNYINAVDAVKLCYNFHKSSYKNKYFNLIGTKKMTIKRVILIILKIFNLKKIIFNPKHKDDYHYKINPYTFKLRKGIFIKPKNEIKFTKGISDLVKFIQNAK